MSAASLADTLPGRGGVLGSVDPRARVLALAAFACVVVAGHRLPMLLAGLALATVLARLARLPAASLAASLGALNFFLAIVVVTLPFTVPGTPWLWLGPFDASREGTVRAVEMALKANGVLLAMAALVGTVEATVLGHALRRLGAPEKLVVLFFFTNRYLAVMENEVRRLRVAMRARCFRLRMSLHTYRSIGYLTGMLLVRGFDRSERVAAAMRCRGFRGRFHVLDDLRYQRRDAVFGAAAACAVAALAWVEWT